MTEALSSARSWRLFLGWFALVFVVAALGSAASIEARTFYAALTQPSWSPPGRVFGPVWTLLYLLMTVAVWRVARMAPSPQRTRALRVFIAQLVANAAWSWLFFAWHLGALASVEVLVLLALVAWTVREFHALDRMASRLIVPYLGWVGFASILCWTMWRLNPGAL